jgi:hypothetical protein
MAPNKSHMTTPNVVINFVDKRKATSTVADPYMHTSSKSVAGFTANATGTVNTIIGANAAPGTNDNNIIRRGEEFQLFNAAGAKKEETIFTVTGIAVAGSTTVTYTPASAVAPVATDDARLVTLGYTDPQINVMTQNDKVFAIRQADNADGI